MKSRVARVVNVSNNSESVTVDNLRPDAAALQAPRAKDAYHDIECTDDILFGDCVVIYPPTADIQMNTMCQRTTREYID